MFSFNQLKNQIKDRLTKEELKDGMIVELYTKKKYLVLNGLLMNENQNTYINLNQYYSDLTGENVEYDVAKIYETLALCLSEIFSEKYLSLVCSREV